MVFKRYLAAFVNTAEYAVVHGIFLKAVISSFKKHLRLVYCKVSSAICEGRQVGLLRATFPNNTISSSKTNLRATGFRVISSFKNRLRSVCCKLSRANPLPAQAGYLREGYWHGTIFSSKTILRLLGRLIINVSGIFPKAVISPFKNHLRGVFGTGVRVGFRCGAFANNIVSFFQIHSSNILKSEGL